MKLKIKIIVIFLLLSTTVLSLGCGTTFNDIWDNGTSENETTSNSETGNISSNLMPMSFYNISITNTHKKETVTVDQSKITEKLTVKEALEMFGKPLPDTRSSIYPIVYSWSLNENEILYIVFETCNYTDFWKELNDGKYILPTETIQYGEGGLRFATENELKAVKEWTLNHKAIAAYIVNNGIKDVLLDTKEN